MHFNLGINFLKKHAKGQTIIEVLIAIGAGVLILTTIASTAVITIRNARFSKQKTEALKYLQEGIENVRIARDNAATWEDFMVLVWADESLSEGMTRTTTVTMTQSDRVTVIVTVFWDDAQGRHEFSSTTLLSQWAN